MKQHLQDLALLAALGCWAAWLCIRDPNVARDWVEAVEGILEWGRAR